ncbi:hypothetical protein NC652_041228 [Populus alba x Populus x berolinensis]|nr:hypothetical protein NC652_041228 [Populus alba x Populus x berolinensis]
MTSVFRAGKTWVLIATDVLGRGMDFKGVKCVINYDFPDWYVSEPLDTLLCLYVG